MYIYEFISNNKLNLFLIIFMISVSDVIWSCWSSWHISVNETVNSSHRDRLHLSSVTTVVHSRVFWIFLPYIIKIDQYNFELYHFKVGAFLRHRVDRVIIIFSRIPNNKHFTICTWLYTMSNVHKIPLFIVIDDFSSVQIIVLHWRCTAWCMKY